MASLDYSQKHCKKCGDTVLAQRKGCNHLIHAIVTLVFLGLWLPIWLIAAMSRGAWRCPKCGSFCS